MVLNILDQNSKNLEKLKKMKKIDKSKISRLDIFYFYPRRRKLTLSEKIKLIPLKKTKKRNKYR